MENEVTGNIESQEINPVNKGLKHRLMALTLSSVPAREWFNQRRESVQPWPEFLNTSRIQLPKAIAPTGKRIMRNIDKFQSNYLFVFLGLILFCILTSPFLLVAIAASLGACYIVSLKNKDTKLKIVGREVSLAQQYAAVGVCSFPLFYIAGAGGAVFWVIGASFFLIMAHAALYNSDQEESATPFDEIKVEEV